MKFFSDTRFLALYSGCVTAVLLVLLLGGFAPEAKKADFDEITVRRLNLVEPDGSLRLVIASKAAFPGAIVRGKEYPHPRGVAGLLFYNDEGTENGGLIFNGAKDAGGKVSAGGSLTFDQYEQDQVIQLLNDESDGRRSAALKINDAPGTSYKDGLELLEKVKSMKDGPEKKKEEARLKDYFGLRNRVYVGKHPDRSAGMTLRDSEGRARLILKVGPDGEPFLEFLDEKGAVTSRLPARNGKTSGE